MESNICVFVFGVLITYCFYPLVSWLCCPLRDWNNWSSTKGRLMVNLSKTNRHFFKMTLFFSLFILSFCYRGLNASIDCLKLTIVTALFWLVPCGMFYCDSDPKFVIPHMWVKEFWEFQLIRRILPSLMYHLLY